MEAFDHVIVGAGSAGCALAERLSRDPRARVLLIEAGGSDRRLRVKVPIGYGMAFHDPAVNWRLTADPDPGLDGRAVYVPRGRVLGGSSAINAMVYVRGLPADYEDWRAAGNPGWGWDEVAAAFARLETRVAPDGAETGGGPVRVADRAAEYHPLKRRFLAAAREAGLPLTADMNGPSPEGVGAYALTTRQGLRWSAADAFLRPALRRPNLALRTGLTVTRLRIEGGRAVGVEARDGRGGAHAFGARYGVVLAAGAVGSPQILQLSGVGPGALLQRLGLPVVLDNPAVGGGLQDHLGVNYFYRSREPTLNQAFGTWPGRIAAALAFALARRGPFSLGVNQMGGMVRSRPDAPAPDMQLYFNPLSYSGTFAGKRPLMRPDPFPGFIISFNPCRPTSRGRIDLASPDPAAPPRIAPGYLSTNEDVAQVLAGARLVGRLQETAALRALLAAPPAFDPSRASEAEILADFRARAGSVFHLCGTCRMAARADGGVVDARLRLHGIDGLRVADASAFPNVTSANTNAPTLMLAARAGEMIAADAA